MPVITIHLLEGRSPETKKELMRGVTETVCRTLTVQPDSVRVILREVAPEDWAVAGMPIREYQAKIKQD